MQIFAHIFFNDFEYTSESCFDIIKDVIENKKDYQLRTTSRNCSQDDFNFVIAGGESYYEGLVGRKVSSININNLSKINVLSNYNHVRKQFNVVCIKGEIYVFGGYDVRFKRVMPVEKYSPASNTWDVITQMYDNRINFGACSFIDSIYLIGGYLYGRTNSCLEFNTKNKTWRKTASTNVARENSSCAVFEGRIVVSGGYNNNKGLLNTVEAYDHIDDSWKYMPNMRV